MTVEEIRRSLTRRNVHHPMVDRQVRAIERVFFEAGVELDRLTPTGFEQSMAFRKLEEALGWYVEEAIETVPTWQPRGAA